MAEKTLVIVESPTKARTITKFLGSKYVVRASNGHIRDLPNSASEIPEKFRKEPWARLGINVDSDFEPLYIVPPNKRENVKALKEALKGADLVLLATDEDREGESISWHLLETLKPKVPVKRLVFHEITKEAIQEALDSPRAVDENLVRAQETRRIVDRLYGYEVSPLLWKKMAPRLSAGRVQSVAIRLLVDRERERMKFIRASYWGLKGKFQKPDAENGVGAFEAELTHVGDKRIAIGKDFDSNTGKLSNASEVIALGESEARKLNDRLINEGAVVASVEEKPYVTKPAPPFVTSTLQQEGNRKLRFSAKRTMTVAQQLYENGFITYMRTDSTTLSQQALDAARNFIKNDFGPEYLTAQPRLYQTKVKNAQEAHEAIRPAGDHFTPPEVVKQQLNEDAFRLYDLIWKRTVASQMQDARGTHITVQVGCGDAKFRATGKTVEFPGFLRAYVEGSDDPEAELADQERLLPKLAPGDKLKTLELEPSEHTTQPPARFTEGSLIKELERLGIGRPSTWATVVETVLNRAYAFKKGTALVPTFTACAVVNLLRDHFSTLLDFQFTARLEDDLDAIARGEAQNIPYLKNFYFGNGHPGLHSLVKKGEKEIDPRIVCGLPIGNTESGTEIEVRIGRFGPFVTDGTSRASVPGETPPDEMTLEVAEQLLVQAAKGPATLGTHPEAGLPIYLKAGRFGPYLQLGDNVEGGDRPKMAGLLPGMKESDVDFEMALRLLSLPKSIGLNPDNKEEIIVANGKFGPYIKCGTDTRSIPAEVSALDFTLEQAIELLKQPKTRGRSSKPKAIKELIHEESKKTYQVMSGRYGPYVTDGEINASLPKGASAENLSLEEAMSLIAARAEKIANGEVPARGKKKKSAGTKTKKAKAKEPAEKAPKTAKKKSTKSKKGSTPDSAAAS